MGLDDVYHVTCDGHVIQHAMPYRKAMTYANLMQTNADAHIDGTRKRTSEFQVKRCHCVIQEEDALYRDSKRRTLVVRP